MPAGQDGAYSTNQMQVNESKKTKELPSLKLGDIMSFEQFMVGAGSGLVRVCIGFPFDQVKIYVQAHRSKGIGVTTAVRTIFQSDGFMGFYIGSAPSFYFSTLQMSLNFGFKSLAEKLMNRNRVLEDAPFTRTFVAGMAGGFMHGLTVCPVDHIRVQQVVHNIPNLTATLRNPQVTRHLFHGLSATVLRDMPGMGFFFSTFAMGSKYLQEELKLNYFYSSLIAGSVAGCFWWGPTYPFDIAKTMMQKNPQKYPSVRSALSHLYSELGFSGFTRGLSVCLYRAAVVNAGVFGAAEFIRNNFFRKENKDV